MTVTVCEHCAEPMGAPHRLLPGDCILGHAAHAERFIGFACKRHYGWIDATLVQIEELFALRGSVLIPGPSGGERTGTRTGSPAPGRIDVMALTDRRITEWENDDPDGIPDVPGYLAGWAAMVEDGAEHAWIRPQRRFAYGPHCALRPDPLLALALRRTCAHVSCGDALPADPPTLSELLRFLRHWRKWIACQPWLDDYVADLAALHRAVARAIGDTMWPQPVGKCPVDGTPLYNTIGVDEVTCRRCKSTWSGPHLARLRLIFEQAEAKAEA